MTDREPRLTDENAQKVLARALELEAQGAGELTVAQIRETASELSIPPTAVDQALSEYGAAGGVASPQRTDAAAAPTSRRRHQSARRKVLSPALMGAAVVLLAIFTSSCGSGTGGRGMSQNALADDEAAILAVLRGVESAFSDADLSRWLSYFHSTYMIMAPEGVIAPASEQEALTLLRPRMETLRARGYARSELNRATVKVLSVATALASVEWVRRKADNAELERLGGTYAFFKRRDGWKIVMVTVHPSTTVVELK